MAKKNGNVTWCRPSDGYDTDNAINIELSSYEVVETLDVELPDSDQFWPKGAPTTGYFKVGSNILRKKIS